MLEFLLSETGLQDCVMPRFTNKPGNAELWLVRESVLVSYWCVVWSEQDLTVALHWRLWLSKRRVICQWVSNSKTSFFVSRDWTQCACYNKLSSRGWCKRWRSNVLQSWWNILVTTLPCKFFISPSNRDALAPKVSSWNLVFTEKNIGHFTFS